MYSQTVEYSMRAMSCLALTPERLVPTPELADQTQVPVNYLAKVLQQLAGAGLITGRRGVGGGYKLARSPGDIRMTEVINAVGSLKRITACPLGVPDRHTGNLCALHRLADRAAKAAIDVFDSATLSDLVREGQNGRPLCEIPASARLTVGTVAARPGRRPRVA
jgi:Rrf2 family transcriptional regulator, nitric oxide-sensitive transcriptional repressor